MRSWNWATLGVGVAIVLWTPSAAAHPSAVGFENGNGIRCYYYDDHDTNTREFWREVNGLLTGGVPQPQEWFGLPAVNGPGSGLQLTSTLVNGQVFPPDERLLLDEALSLCFV